LPIQVIVSNCTVWMCEFPVKKVQHQTLKPSDFTVMLPIQVIVSNCTVWMCEFPVKKVQHQTLRPSDIPTGLAKKRTIFRSFQLLYMTT